jgi:hypothetical protein
MTTGTGHGSSGSDDAFRYPDFYHIGAYKAASTSLHYYLAQHPDIYMASEKGGNYLAFTGKDATDKRQFGQRITTEADYRALFSAYSGQRLVGESSPHYLVSARACRRIQELRPDAKLIVVLRNPADTIYARYLMRRRNGSIDEDFPAVLSAEETILAGGEGRSRLHLETAFHYRHLQPYLRAFPREQIHLRLFDDLRRDRDGELRQLFAFLGVDPDFVPTDERHYNRSGVPRGRWMRFVMRQRRRLPQSVKNLVPARARGAAMERMSNRLERPDLAPRERQRLIDLYRDDILSLQQLVDRDLSHWLGQRP